MKRMIKRGLTLCLVLALALGQTLASEALGSDLLSREVQLAAGTAVTDGSLWSATYSDLRTEHYITYTPNSGVAPLIWYGDTVSSTAKLTDAAQSLAQQGYRVVAGVNGGFFNTDGTAVGLLITDGVIRSLDQYNYKMAGICADGSVFIDSSTISKTASWFDYTTLTEVSLNVTAINESRKNGGLYLYSEDFGTSTKNSLSGVDVVLEPAVPGQQLTMNSTMTLRVVHVTDSTAEGVTPDNAIPAGCFVLSANQNCSESILAPLRALTPGMSITLDISGGDPRWANAQYGITGLYTLVENGQAISGLPAGAAPRTALGVKADGSIVLYTIDGRQSGYSVGASYSQTAKRLVELGCVQAIALDGGGSTTLGATLPGSDELTVLNQPSGGSQRAVSNCIFLVTPAVSGGFLSSFYVDSAYDVVLTGAKTTVTAAPAGQNGVSAVYNGTVSWSADGGLMGYDDEGNAVYLAGSQPGSFTITASGQGVTGSAPIRVVEHLSKLTVTRHDTGAAPGTLTLSPGDTVDLDAAGTWYNIPVAMDDGNVTWSVEGNIGTIDENGLFTAGAVNGSGSVTASAGGKSVIVAVTVNRGDPFTDLDGHWSQEYVTRLYKMGLTTGSQKEDGSYIYNPDGKLTRGELLVFISRMLGVDTAQYAGVELPFADAAGIPEWMLPHVKAMYALQVFSGSGSGGVLYANVGELVSREQAMTMLGRILAGQQSCDLSAFSDGSTVSTWAAPYVQTLVAQNIVSGSNGLLSPKNSMTRGEVAKLLTMVSDLPRAELTLRPDLMTEADTPAAAAEQSNGDELPAVEENSAESELSQP
jgi:hypothetical protein